MEGGGWGCGVWEGEGKLRGVKEGGGGGQVRGGGEREWEVERRRSMREGSMIRG